MSSFDTEAMAHRLYRSFLDLMALAELDPKAAIMVADWIEHRCADDAETEIEKAFVLATLNFLFEAAKD